MTWFRKAFIESNGSDPYILPFMQMIKVKQIHFYQVYDEIIFIPQAEMDATQQLLQFSLINNAPR
jgi:hypothetical protein